MSVSLTRGSSRETLSPEEVLQLRQQGSLVVDARRMRPRYFDGRFLSARDLIRDQQYMLIREADLARTVGSGVAEGLQVGDGDNLHSLRIRAGQGVTPAGELVRLPADLAVNLADIAMSEQLSARFGLTRVPATPPRSRTGLFVLALRPVEYTDNPVGAYPTSLTGPRTVEDGDVIEATAVVLIPWQEDGAADQPAARRARAARTIFTQPQDRGISANVLPLAMLALQSNTLVWIDEAMVRRELGSDRGDLPGLGFSPRGLRLAHLMQYQNHLADVVVQLSGRTFAAASQFEALPPAGPLPPGIINPADFTQRFFPSMVDVDFSIIPEDELPALVEETLALPPIDLRASDAALDMTAVLVLAPVPRDEFRAVAGRLSPRTRLLRPAAPNLVARRKPLEVLQGLRLPSAISAPAIPTPADAEWARLAQLPSLWYVRRRNLAYRDDLVGVPLALAGFNELAVETSVRNRLEPMGLVPVLDRVLSQSSPRAAASILSLLATPRLVASPVLTAATLGALQQQIDANAAPVAVTAPATPSASPAASTAPAPVPSPATTAPPAPTPNTGTGATNTPPPISAPPSSTVPSPTNTPPSTGTGGIVPPPVVLPPPIVTLPPVVVRPPIGTVVLDQTAVLAVASDINKPALSSNLNAIQQASGGQVSNATLATLASGNATKINQLTTQLTQSQVSAAATPTVRPAIVAPKPTLPG
ncbi:MAG: hypothetical protein IPG57_10105 [Burkholderiales bacterium]|jgi:hypothetical protein|nr:hypothetical protein [Burkholderiales bacterium]HQY07103.1 hypothetical protein [Burkholderiaceae bacterium]